MKNSFINKKNEKSIQNSEINNYIFGLTFGFGITLIFIFRLLYKKLGLLSIIDLIFILYGIFCIILATINPKLKLLTKIRNLNIKIFNFFGNLILKTILFVVYFIFVVPVGMYVQKKEKSMAATTNFVDYKDCYNTKPEKYKFLKIFKLFASDYFYMIPLIIVLLIISFLVVLITSSVFTPLIYTLF